jgi:hypothetical protein
MRSIKSLESRKLEHLVASRAEVSANDAPRPGDFPSEEAFAKILFSGKAWLAEKAWLPEQDSNLRQID